ncbi:Uncharacterised protein [Pseudescherichia vulneris]|nr:Uncharacterised protein [Pseudescherichia vulneris]
MPKRLRVPCSQLTHKPGEREWTFDAIPAEIRQRHRVRPTSGPHMSADEANGLVYLPVSSPFP